MAGLTTMRHWLDAVQPLCEGLPRVTVNPTKGQLAALLRTSLRKALRGGYADQIYGGEEGGHLRGVVTPDKLVVWDGYLATHHDLGYGHVRDDDPEMLIEITQDGVTASLPGDVERLRNNPHLQRAYGGVPPVKYED